MEIGGLETELILKVGGKFIQLASIAGAIVGYFNKKQVGKNIKHITERLEKIEVSIGEITEQQERNFTFRIAEIVNITATERQFEKIDMFANIIKNGIIDFSIADESEEIDKIIDITSQLHLEDIRFLENLYNKTRFELITKDGQKSGIFNFRSLTLDCFQINTLRDGRKETNHFDFNKNAVAILHKCIANGLVEQSFRAEKVINETIKAGKIDMQEMMILGKSNLGFEYKISDFYSKMRKYILDTQK
jgi:hypothetical protein